MTTSREEALAHEQARILSAEAVDSTLAPEEAAWLDEHLAACSECRAVADEYAAIHVELSSLSMPEPPRELWARTRAALDNVDASTPRRRSRGFSSRTSLFGSSIAVAAVVLITVASLLGQTPLPGHSTGSGVPAPIANGSGASASPGGGGSTSPLAVVNGTSYWISGQNGLYQIKGGSSDCDPADVSCTVKSGGGQTLGMITSDTTVSAALAPNADVAAVWTTDKIAIMPLTQSGPTVSLDLLTPQPTIAPTATPIATATPSASPTPSATPSETASEAIAGSPVPSPVPTASIVATPVVTPSPATPAPTARPTPAAATTSALAILTGFEIVGQDPQFSPDGRVVAFSARPSDHSSGPDVFIWQSGDRQAHAVTASHSDLFSGWFGTRVLISEISAAAAPSGAAGASSAQNSVGSSSYVFDPATGQELRITRPMLMPVVDPSGQYVVYWSGTVEFDPSTGLWQPGGGDLFFDKWSNLVLVPVQSPTESATPTPAATATSSQSAASASAGPSAEPTETASQSVAPIASPSASPATASLQSPGQESPAVATATPTAMPTPTATPTPKSNLPQALPVAHAAASVKTWQVSWDGLGQHVAIWVADKGSAKVGRLSLFSVDRNADIVDTDPPLLNAERVMASIQFDSSHLLYTSALDGKTYLQAMPPMSPSNVATPGIEASPQTGGSASATPLSTDRPGN